MSLHGNGSETLGQRIRRLRQERELTQAELGRTEFSRHYVDTVEQDRLRPSAEALDLLAHRLAIPAALLHAAPTPAIGSPAPGAVDEDIAYQLAHARVQINAEPRRVLEQISRIEQQYPLCCPHLREQTRFWLHSLRGMAYLRIYEPALAQPELNIALELAPHLADAAQEVVRVRNALGAAYYMLDQPDHALREHVACLRALRLANIKDPSLRVIVYSNVANDYWALNDIGQALGIYQEALHMLDDIEHGERRAGVLWGLCMAYFARKDLDRAKLYAAEALTLYGKKGDVVGTAHITNNLAEIEIERHEYAEAEVHLARAQVLFREAGEDLYVSQVLQNYASLEVTRGRIAEAVGYAGQALQLCEQVLNHQENGTPAQTKANAIRTYARLLGTAGHIAEHLEQAGVADDRFQQAFALLDQAMYNETAFALELAYAELLAARGDHTQATGHYQKAAERRPQRWRN